jgi:acetoin utilization protein AcuB
MATVSEAMTDNVVTVAVTASVREAIQAMHDSDIRHVPVVEDGELVGIVSDRDLQAFAPGIPLEAAGGERSLDLPVTRVMSTDLQTVTTESDLNDAVDLMVEHRIGAVPVIDPNTNELVGIVSTIDALRVMRG